MASTNYETNTKFADMTNGSADENSKKIETPYMDHGRGGTHDADSKDGEVGQQEWTGRK